MTPATDCQAREVDVAGSHVRGWALNLLRAAALRCREDVRADLLRARHRLSKFLLRHGRRFTATKKPTP
jgi:hypothetical protein